MKALLLREAREDLRRGWLFYQSKSPGLGDYFLDSLSRDIQDLETLRVTHQVIHGFHVMPARKFPFAIFYRIQNATIEIVAIIDGRRNPTWIGDRLGSDNN